MAQKNYRHSGRETLDDDDNEDNYDENTNSKCLDSWIQEITGHIFTLCSYHYCK